MLAREHIDPHLGVAPWVPFLLSFLCCPRAGHACAPPPSKPAELRETNVCLVVLVGHNMGVFLRWSTSCDSYRRIASEIYRCDSNQ